MKLTNNERRALGLVFRSRHLTQAMLLEQLQLTQQSVSRIVNHLLDKGLLLKGERMSDGQRGFPRAHVSLNPHFTYSFGIGLMADAISLTMIDFAGTLHTERKAVLGAMTRVRVIEWLQTNIRELIRLLPAQAGISGAGIAVAGSFIDEGRRFNTVRTLEEWALIDIEGLLSEALDMPVWADNDGNTAALGEREIGVGRWAKSFAYFYISSGVGGGVILNGEPWRGNHGNAGEFAGGLPLHLFPSPNLELLRHLVAKEDAFFPSVGEMLDNFNPEWPAIDDWIARVHDSVSIMASNASSILDVDAVVLGGRIPVSLAVRLIPHVTFFDQQRRAQKRPTAALVPAEAQTNAAAFGAALLPLRARFF